MDRGKCKRHFDSRVVSFKYNRMIIFSGHMKPLLGNGRQLYVVEILFQ
jgi:hypothetical protein